MEVVYSAFGRRHLQEAVISAASVKRKMPQVKISLTTDRLISSPAFDQVHVVDGCPDSEDPARFAKFHKASAIRNSASELVLYLDADTYVGADLASITSALDHADIALAHDTWRMTGVYRTLHPTMDLRDEPPWRTYLNTGVMLVRKSPAIMDFIEAWMGAFARDQRLQREQIVFQRLIYDSGLRLHVLPSEMNLRACEPVQISGPVLILHRVCHPQPEPSWRASSPYLLDFLNSSTTNRVFTPHDGRMVVLTEDFRFLEKNLNDHTAHHEREEYMVPDLRFG